jgi:hypothetical protein
MFDIKERTTEKNRDSRQGFLQAAAGYGTTPDPKRNEDNRETKL